MKSMSGDAQTGGHSSGIPFRSGSEEQVCGGKKPTEMDKIPTLRSFLSTFCPSLSRYLETLVREYWASGNQTRQRQI